MELTSTLLILATVPYLVETVSPVNTHQTHHWQEDTHTDTGTTFHAEWIEVLGIIPGVTCLYEGQFNPLFKSFKQSEKMNISCEIDDVAQGAPLAFDKSWNFDYLAGSPALSGGVTDFARLFPQGLPFFGMKQVNFLDKNNDQNYYFAAPLPSARFGAWL